MGRSVRVSRSRAEWEGTTLAESLARAPERAARFVTSSGIEAPRVASAEDLGPGWDPRERLGFPGEYPFTRGVHATMHRGRLWTMRMFAGYGAAEDTNRRFKYLLDRGQTGLSVAFDLPTLMGRDSDDPAALGEVGREGVAIDTVEDMAILFDGIPLEDVSTSMTINGPAAAVFAMYLALAERRGVPFDRLRGTLQNDVLKEFIAQKEYLYPPAPSVRLAFDVVEFCAREAPLWNPISISGYHIREAGSTAVQELAFTLADGFAYVEEGIRRGLAADSFAPRLSFFWNAHNDFFEEIAKMRAARRLWATRLAARYGARDPRSLALRFHAQTAGCTLTDRQPLVNVARVALQALAAVLGGAQSLHTDSYDETLCLPTEEAARVALRTQQVIAHESGVAATVDPLGGSYYVEWLTDRVEREAAALLERIEGMGGIVAAIERGFPQREIAESAAAEQRAVESGEKVVVGVNRFVVPPEEDAPPRLLRIDPAVEERQRKRLAAVRGRRDEKAVLAALGELREACRKGINSFPAILEAARRSATVGEISAAVREVFGAWEESALI